MSVNPQSESSVRETIRDFMVRSFKGRKIADDDDIFALGFGSSLFAIELISFVEKTCDIEVDSEDLDMGNFRSIDAVTELVMRKKGMAVRS